MRNHFMVGAILNSGLACFFVDLESLPVHMQTRYPTGQEARSRQVECWALVAVTIRLSGLIGRLTERGKVFPFPPSQPTMLETETKGWYDMKLVLTC
jgi:hypothetical protein